MKMKSPNAFKWSLKFGLISALTGMICCVAPAILFMFGLMGGVVAISFADFFYAEDGSLGTGSILLRILAFFLGIYGFIMYRKKQNQCSIDPKRKKLNLTLLTFLLLTFGVSFFLAFESLSGWYFDEYIVPQQQIELKK
jgi:Ca2+/Na+ antiporter|tara:strand:+ start:7986 stop:8402 length:417 start_codon:yes stop_codon:yes gene_type:complete